MHPLVKCHMQRLTVPLFCIPSAIHSSLGLVDTEVIALPRRGRKCVCCVSTCHNTKTPSMPTDNRYAPTEVYEDMHMGTHTHAHNGNAVPTAELVHLIKTYTCNWANYSVWTIIGFNHQLFELKDRPQAPKRLQGFAKWLSRTAVNSWLSFELRPYFMLRLAKSGFKVQSWDASRMLFVVIILQNPIQ